MSSQPKRTRGSRPHKAAETAQLSREELVKWVQSAVPTFAKEEAETLCEKNDYNQDDVQDHVLNYVQDHRHAEASAWEEVPKKKTKAEAEQAVAASAKETTAPEREVARGVRGGRGGARGGRGGSARSLPKSADEGTLTSANEASDSQQPSSVPSRGGRGGRGGHGGRGGYGDASTANGNGAGNGASNAPRGGRGGARGGRGDRQQVAAASPPPPAQPVAPPPPSYASMLTKQAADKAAAAAAAQKAVAEAAAAKLAAAAAAAAQAEAAQRAVELANLRAQQAETEAAARRLAEAEERKLRLRQEKLNALQQQKAAAAATAVAVVTAPVAIVEPTPVPSVLETPSPVQAAVALAPAAKPAAPKAGGAASVWSKRPAIAAVAPGPVTASTVETPISAPSTAAALLDVARDPVVIPAHKKAGEYDASVSQLKFGNFAAAAAAGGVSTDSHATVTKPAASVFQPQTSFPAGFSGAASAYTQASPYGAPATQPVGSASAPVAVPAAATSTPALPQMSPQEQYALYARQYGMMGGMPGPYGMPYGMDGGAMPYYAQPHEMYAQQQAFGMMAKPQVQGQAQGPAVGGGKGKHNRPQGAAPQAVSPQGKLDAVPTAQAGFPPPYMNYGYNPYAAYGQYNPQFRGGYGYQAPFYAPQNGFPAQPTVGAIGALQPNAALGGAATDSEHQQNELHADASASAVPIASDYAPMWQQMASQPYDASKALADTKGAVGAPQQFAWPQQQQQQQQGYYGQPQQGYEQQQRWSQ